MRLSGVGTVRRVAGQVPGEQRVLLKVEDEERNVVLLRAGGVVARKTGDVVEEGVSETSDRDIELRFQEFFAACLAEFLLRGVLGFEESVRVEHTDPRRDKQR